ncbi:hypothetical protein FVE85_4855 [Porphyridium purpureum]|uniref:Uncharacterized protein n=1 Tax=Porphyridium purpureum TaxID=35688 RepID=A0A5J4YQW4_PORPP|nr:hypothetical protein FVE85_4855 [Porphyridium purpureum]|eukprot:POR8566..scf236_6
MEGCEPCLRRARALCRALSVDLSPDLLPALARQYRTSLPAVRLLALDALRMGVAQGYVEQAEAYRVALESLRCERGVSERRAAYLLLFSALGVAQERFRNDVEASALCLQVLVDARTACSTQRRSADADDQQGCTSKAQCLECESMTCELALALLQHIVVGMTQREQPLSQVEPAYVSHLFMRRGVSDSSKAAAGVLSRLLDVAASSSNQAASALQRTRGRQVAFRVALIISDLIFVNAVSHESLLEVQSLVNECTSCLCRLLEFFGENDDIVAQATRTIEQLCLSFPHEFVMASNLVRCATRCLVRGMLQEPHVPSRVQALASLLSKLEAWNEQDMEYVLTCIDSCLVRLSCSGTDGISMCSEEQDEIGSLLQKYRFCAKLRSCLAGVGAIVMHNSLDVHLGKRVWLPEAHASPESMQ